MGVQSGIHNKEDEMFKFALGACALIGWAALLSQDLSQTGVDKMGSSLYIEQRKRSHLSDSE